MNLIASDPNVCQCLVEYNYNLMNVLVLQLSALQYGACYDFVSPICTAARGAIEDKKREILPYLRMVSYFSVDSTELLAQMFKMLTP